MFGFIKNYINKRKEAKEQDKKQLEHFLSIYEECGACLGKGYWYRYYYDGERVREHCKVCLGAKYVLRPEYDKKSCGLCNGKGWTIEAKLR